MTLDFSFLANTMLLSNLRVFKGNTSTVTALTRLIGGLKLHDSVHSPFLRLAKSYSMLWTSYEKLALYHQFNSLIKNSQMGFWGFGVLDLRCRFLHIIVNGCAW